MVVHSFVCIYSGLLWFYRAFIRNFPEKILIRGWHFCPLFLITLALRSRCAEEQTVYMT